VRGIHPGRPPMPPARRAGLGQLRIAPGQPAHPHPQLMT
jgi:hypothetical protein